MNRYPQRAFVTGANGFIGRAVMTRLALQGIETLGMDRTADPGRHVVAGDVADENAAWQAHARGCDLFVHTAAVVSNSARPDEYRRVSLGGTVQALHAAMAGGATRFVHVSSIAAYGLDFCSDRHEDHALSLLSGYPYCDAKAASEQPVLAAHAAGGIEVSIVRPGDVYGPGSRPWVLIPLELMRKRQFILPMGGDGLFSPVYIDNLLEGLLLAATHEAAAGQVFNLTDGVSVPCREFFAWHHRWLGRPGAPLSVPRRVPQRLTEAVAGAADLMLNRVLGQTSEISAGSMAMLAQRAGYSIDKARQRLGYSPMVDLVEGMRRTEAWLRNRRLL